MEQVTVVPGFTFPAPTVRIETAPQLSFFSPKGPAITEARWSEIPPPVQGLFNQWAATSVDEPDGQHLFDDMFYRFFFVHELGHWQQDCIIQQRTDAGAAAAKAGYATNHWQNELNANTAERGVVAGA